MESNAKKTTKWMRSAVLVLALAAVTVLVAKLETSRRAFAHNNQTTFESPDDAGAALAKAAKNEDEIALADILGIDSKSALTTGDKDTDKAAMDAFVSKYQKMNRWVDMTDGSRELYIGADNFAFPVPLAKNSSGRWYFDGVAGSQEIRTRDIGRNELLAIDACAAIANAQDVFFARSGSSPEYTQRIISTPGQQDGLYWPASDKKDVSPLQALRELPKSSLRELSGDRPVVIDGYTLRILTAQGDDAPGGAMNYIVNGRMTAGFAILATPVNYAETGIMTFMTGSDGIVYERDFGPDTVTTASSIREFNPTDDWSPVE
jgi:Protein of unknown function (DUF2950)